MTMELKMLNQINFYIVMKRVYYLLGIGLLSTIALTSCGEDTIVNENGGMNNPAGEQVDYTFTASIKQAEALGRANMQNGVYAWNSGDVVTLWNRNIGAGYNFTISSTYDGTQPKAEAEFAGKAAVSNGHKVIAVFPAKEALSFNDLATFTMPEVCVQTAGAAELGANTYMVATGDVVDNKIPALTFMPLTALVQFNLKNTSDRELKIRTITLESDKDVFPAEIKIDEKGEVKSYMGMRKKITLDLQGQVLNIDQTLNGYLNLLPTTYGDIRLMKDNTLLTVTVNLLNQEQEQNIILLKEVAVKDLKNKIDLDMDASANQFAAGGKYEMNFEVDYRFKVPEEGYLISEDGNIHIYNKEGLLAWKQIMEDHRGVNVILEKDYIDGGVIDFLGEATWQPISALTGTFEGNGVTIENMILAKDGFITNNNGTVQNLNFKNISFSGNVVSGAGTIASVNNSIIQNCSVDGITATVTKPVKVGGLVGQNAQGAIIDNCKVLSGTIALNLSGSDSGNACLGGLVGENYGGKGIIVNSFVGAIAITHLTPAKNASNLGGLIGYNNLGWVKACYSLANLTINCSVQSGGLIGVNANGSVLASYAAGSINGTVVNNTGGLIGYNNINNDASIVTSCYATTQLLASNAAGNKFGAFIGTNGKGTNQCYSINKTIDAVIGSGTMTGVSKVEAGQLSGNKLRAMNMTLEKAEPGFKFNFKLNEDPITKENQPLVLQPAVSVPGFGGSDFGDGGDI